MAPYPPIAVTIAPSLLPASAAAAAPAAEPAAEPAAAQPSPLAAGLAAHEVEDLDERLADLLDRESAENIAAFLGLAPSAPPSPPAGPLPSFGASAAEPPFRSSHAELFALGRNLLGTFSEESRVATSPREASRNLLGAPSPGRRPRDVIVEVTPLSHPRAPGLAP